MSLHRTFRTFVRQPGVGFTFAVGVLVIFGAIALWSASHPANGKESGLERRPQAQARSGEDLPEPVRSVSRALLDMANLAYEESLGSPLDDGVKQADFALIQAMLRCGIPLEDAVVEKTELRHASGGAYHFQRLRLLVGEDTLPFVTSLHESLRAWAENAALAQSGEEREGPAVDESRAFWVITINDAVTHELVLAHSPADEGPTQKGERKFTRRRGPGVPARVVIVIDDLGEDMRAVRKLASLPFPVTFAIWPHSTNAKQAAQTGHAAGLEILVHQPTEPIKYPEMNPGPRALFVSLSDLEIEARVRESVRRVPHAVGMNNHMGSRFTRNRRAAAAMARPLRDLGFFVLDSVTHPGSVLYAEAKKQGLPVVKRDIFLDVVQTRENVLRQLRKAEKMALVTGSAVVIGHPLPQTLAALSEWDSLRNSEIEYVRLADILK